MCTGNIAAEPFPVDDATANQKVRPRNDLFHRINTRLIVGPLHIYFRHPFFSLPRIYP